MLHLIAFESLEREAKNLPVPISAFSVFNEEECRDVILIYLEELERAA